MYPNVIGMLIVIETAQCIGIQNTTRFKRTSEPREEMTCMGTMEKDVDSRETLISDTQFSGLPKTGEISFS